MDEEEIVKPFMDSSAGRWSEDVSTKNQALGINQDSSGNITNIKNNLLSPVERVVVLNTTESPPCDKFGVSVAVISGSGADRNIVWAFFR